jgi:hypothetical protein
MLSLNLRRRIFCPLAQLVERVALQFELLLVL